MRATDIKPDTDYLVSENPNWRTRSYDQPYKAQVQFIDGAIARYTDSPYLRYAFVPAADGSRVRVIQENGIADFVPLGHIRGEWEAASKARAEELAKLEKARQAQIVRENAAEQAARDAAGGLERDLGLKARATRNRSGAWEITVSTQSAEEFLRAASQ